MKHLKYGLLDEEQTLHSLADVPIPSVHLSDFMWQHLEQHAERRILIDGSSGVTLTGDQVKQWAMSVAVSLISLGVGEGDIVCCFMPDNALYACAIVGIYFSGAAFSGVFTGTDSYESLPVSELLSQVQELEPKILICSPAILPHVVGIADSVESVTAILMLQPPDAGTSDEAAKTKGGKDVHVVDWNSDTRGIHLPVVKKADPKESVVYFPFSSGSTGKPKGVLKTDEAMVAHAVSMKAAFDSNDRIEISTAGFAHSVGLWYLHFGIACGFPTVLHDGDKYFPQLLRLVQQYKCTHVWLSPSELNRMNKLNIYADYDLSSWRMLVLAAALVPVPVVRDFVHLTGGRIRTSIWYGSTESGIVSSIPDREERMDSLGCLMPNQRVRIVDRSTRVPLPVGSEGEIMVRGVQKTSRYFNRPDANAEHIVDEWFATGDRGYFDAEGLLFMVGRYKDLIKVHGFQVAPAELEEKLMRHEEIAEAAVIGIPDDQYLEVPKAFVTVRNGVRGNKLADIMMRVNADVQYWKKLRGGIEVLPNLPTISIGKIDKQALRKHVSSPLNVVLPSVDDDELQD